MLFCGCSWNGRCASVKQALCLLLSEALAKSPEFAGACAFVCVCGEGVPRLIISSKGSRCLQEAPSSTPPARAPHPLLAAPGRLDNHALDAPRLFHDDKSPPLVTLLVYSFLISPFTLSGNYDEPPLAK